jgi:hypothetical protein
MNSKNREEEYGRREGRKEGNEVKGKARLEVNAVKD